MYTVDIIDRSDPRRTGGSHPNWSLGNSPIVVFSYGMSVPKPRADAVL